MEYLADLHSHSTASDGQYRPGELVRLAKEAGIQVLALTDHDNLDGTEEALAAGEALGLTVLRGVELGAAEDRHLHILGLGLRGGDSPLSRLCDKMKQGREERKYRIVDFLAEKGVPVPLGEVEALAKNGLVARPHFARVLLSHGYVSSVREAFDKYLDTDEYQKIERFKAPARDCIDAIHSAGGKAVLAHPYQLGLEDGELERLLSYLKDWGLDGLECHYPRHSPRQLRDYLALAKHFGLQVTAGSDFHGEAVRPENPLRPVSLELDWLLGG